MTHSTSRQWFAWTSITLLMAAIGIWLRGWAINGDTSWLIDVGERVLSGQKLYRDVIDNNPPMSIYLYFPGILAAKALGIASETGVILQGLAVTFLSVTLIMHMSTRSSLFKSHIEQLGWVAALSYSFLLLPVDSALQREYFAVLLIFPFLFSMMRRATNEAFTSLPLQIIIGLLAGLGSSIKPHFVLPIATSAIVCAIYMRSWRPVFAIEALVAATIFIVYFISFLLFFSDYFETVWPMVQVAYLPATRSFSTLIGRSDIQFAFIIISIMLLLFVSNKIKINIIILISGLLSFAIISFAQTKGFYYHLLPVFMIAVPVFILVIFQQKTNRIKLLFSIFGLVVLLFCNRQDKIPQRSMVLTAEVVKLKKTPNLLVVAHDLNQSFPLARTIGAKWASRSNAQWATLFSKLRRANYIVSAEERAAQDAVMKKENDMLIEDIRRFKPEIIVLDQRDHDWRPLVFKASDVDIVSNYKLAKEVTTDGKYLIYVREEATKNAP
jgi:hypothetical protein